MHGTHFYFRNAIQLYTEAFCFVCHYNSVFEWKWYLQLAKILNYLKWTWIEVSKKYFEKKMEAAEPDILEQIENVAAYVEIDEQVSNETKHSAPKPIVRKKLNWKHKLNIYH